MDRTEKNQKSSNRILKGIAIGFIVGLLVGILTELPLSNVTKIFTDSGDTSGLLFVKF